MPRGVYDRSKMKSRRKSPKIDLDFDDAPPVAKKVRIKKSIDKSAGPMEMSLNVPVTGVQIRVAMQQHGLIGTVGCTAAGLSFTPKMAKGKTRRHIIPWNKLAKLVESGLLALLLLFSASTTSAELIHVTHASGFASMAFPETYDFELTMPQRLNYSWITTLWVQGIDLGEGEPIRYGTASYAFSLTAAPFDSQPLWEETGSRQETVTLSEEGLFLDLEPGDYRLTVQGIGGTMSFPSFARATFDGELTAIPVPEPSAFVLYLTAGIGVFVLLVLVKFFPK